MVKKLTKSYGISDFFTHGRESKVIESKVPFSISICYEETFAELIREGYGSKVQTLFVNVTNDNYYPNSRLPQQHFDHAKLRAVENGVPLIRACNTGITGVVDRFGRVVSVLGKGGRDSEWQQGALDVTFQAQSHRTFPGGLIGEMQESLESAHQFCSFFCRYRNRFKGEKKYYPD